MRTSIAALALIRGATPTGEAAWLTQWNTRWQALSLVGGKKRADETFRACCIREIAEELSLRPEHDFQIADEPRGRLEFDDWSQSAQAQTHYLFEIFDVRLDTSALASLQNNPDNGWVTTAEIAAGLSSDGRSISPTVRRVLAELGEI